MFNMVLETFKKDLYSNTLVFIFKIEPELSTLPYLDWTEIIITNLPLYNGVYKYENGILEMKYEYNTSLQG